MMTFIYIVCGLMIVCNCSIVAWIIVQSRKSDEQYEREIAKIYGEK